MTQTDFAQSARLLRSGDPTATATATLQISSQVYNICNILGYALPSDWNVKYYSPYQVYVIAYYLASGDKLADSYAECQTRMSNIQNWLSSQGFNAPYEGKAPWGDAGYIYRRPTSILFNDAVQTDLLSRYAAVHGLQ